MGSNHVLRTALIFKLISFYPYYKAQTGSNISFYMQLNRRALLPPAQSLRCHYLLCCLCSTMPGLQAGSAQRGCPGDVVLWQGEGHPPAPCTRLGMHSPSAPGSGKGASTLTQGWIWVASTWSGYDQYGLVLLPQCCGDARPALCEVPAFSCENPPQKR